MISIGVSKAALAAGVIAREAGVETPVPSDLTPEIDSIDDETWRGRPPRISKAESSWHAI